MIVSSQLLKRLASLYCREGVLSAYLLVDPSLMHIRHHPVAEFKAALKRVENHLPATQGQGLQREAGRVLRFLEESWRPNGKALVIFSSEPIGLWETISLQVAIPNAAYFGETPFVGLLARIIDEHERYATVVVDKDDARLYIIQMGEIELESEVFDADVPGRHDQGGWAQARFQRHVEFHIHEHLKHVLDRLERYAQARPFDRLILGGPEEALAEFRKMLPSVLWERLIGTFHASASNRPSEILARAATVFEAYERAEEEVLVNRIAEDAAAGGPGALGPAATLEALNRGRVHKLVVVNGLTLPGAECHQCGLLLDRPAPTCPSCGSATRELSNLVERAVQRAYEDNGGVEVVFGRAAEWLTARGGIGAQLRF